MRVLRGLGVAAVAAAGSVGASRGAYELLAAQARIARKVIPKPTTWPFNGDGLYLPGASAPQPWRLGMRADRELMIEALHQAVALSHPVYDLLYAVLARRTGAGVLTCDRRLATLLDSLGVPSFSELAGQ